MIRKIITIDSEKCNGCGACAKACHEGAIGMKNRKAVLLRDDYCDGLGDCLPACPTGAITFVHREAAAYDEKAVQQNKKLQSENGCSVSHLGCPGNRIHSFAPQCPTDEHPEPISAPSCLGQWPCQIKLVPVNAPYFENAELLIAADCTAFAYGSLHSDFMKGKITLIGCPKLDAVDYSLKLSQIISGNSIKNITLLRMEVPCCGGLELAAKRALEASGKALSLRVVTFTLDGHIK